ncbi:hypothetical protein [Williamsia sp. CHRR-6]|uniref:hypothetical protein n=1 Tax=Williamsia sp. CHRR-6 TaxID=2835871 RepID=UPI001BDB129D|nr:hypothetical protein [Williamsia sp. CHRR-6]MBT0567261.1 hypothetical protein [Williamsia sp. CHRR-6]
MTFVLSWTSGGSVIVAGLGLFLVVIGILGVWATMRKHSPIVLTGSDIRFARGSDRYALSELEMTFKQEMNVPAYVTIKRPGDPARKNTRHIQYRFYAVNANSFMSAVAQMQEWRADSAEFDPRVVASILSLPDQPIEVGETVEVEVQLPPV